MRHITVKKVLICHIALISNAYAMDTYAMDTMDNSMQQIMSWQQVAPFAGKMVAYKTNTLYLNSGNSAHQLQILRLFSDFCYGYISSIPMDWLSGGRGYKLEQLSKPKTLQWSKALTNDIIKKDTLYMRVIVPVEARAILHVLSSGTASIWYKDQLDIAKFLVDCSDEIKD